MGCGCAGERDSPSEATKSSPNTTHRTSKPTRRHKMLKKQSSLRTDLLPQSTVRTLRGSIEDVYRLGKPVSDANNPALLTGVHIVTNQPFTLLEIHEPDESRYGVAGELPAEVELGLSLDHPNILRAHELLREGEKQYAVFEHFGGVLAKRKDCFGPRNVDKVGKIVLQIVRALQYTHGLALVHKNLNLSTVALKDDDLTVKVLGFGAAPQSFTRKKLKNSPYFHYIAPELLQGEESEKCDIWSCGVIMHVLITGFDVVRRAHTQQVQFPKNKWLGVRADVQTLVKRMMSRDARVRPTAEEFLEHPWIKEIDTSVSSKSKVVRSALTNLCSRTPRSAIKETIARFILKCFYPQSELAAMADVFRAADSCHDWQLTRSELTEVLRKVMPDHKAEFTVDYIMFNTDLDGNGYISYSEFLLAAIDEDKIFNDENLIKVFNCLDRDNSGWVSVEELREAFVINAPAQDVAALWKKALKQVDRSENGQLEFAEFQALCAKVCVHEQS